MSCCYLVAIDRVSLDRGDGEALVTKQERLAIVLRETPPRDNKLWRSLASMVARWDCLGETRYHPFRPLRLAVPGV
jgi:hypothetical protein